MRMSLVMLWPTHALYSDTDLSIHMQFTLGRLSKAGGRDNL